MEKPKNHGLLVVMVEWWLDLRELGRFHDGYEMLSDGWYKVYVSVDDYKDSITYDCKKGQWWLTLFGDG